jgi:hypothetical protein
MSNPTTLYRYRRLKDSLAYTLREIAGELWCAYAETINDPFDGLRHAPSEVRVVPSPHEGDTPRTNRTLEITKHWAIACFTESWESPTMWAHYSDNYNGICVGYSFDKLSEYVSEQNRHLARSREFIAQHGGINLDAQIERTFHLLKVDYVAKFPNDFSNPLQAVRTKTADWSYEREWRLVTQGRLGRGGEETAGTTLFFSKPMITEILFSTRVDKPTIRTLVAARDAVDKNITLAGVQPRRSGMGFERV